MSPNEQQELFEFDQRPTIKGFPELRWTGKRPYRSTVYYPAQLREQYGEAHQGGEHDGWINKIFWGDNLQVMSHMLAEYRGQVDLIYIDPPFDSKADYKKKIKLRGIEVSNDSSSFEEKQYGDIWTNDEYLQFMYERLILCRELLADTGSIYLHCDWHKSHHLRMLMDEIFGSDNFVNEIIWQYSSGGASKRTFARKHDTLLFYSRKPDSYTFNPQVEKSYNRGFKPYRFKGVQEYEDEIGWHTLVAMRDVWKLDMVGRSSSERQDYPTQKPESLLRRIIEVSSNPGDLVFDCFMGSGTTQAVAMKHGRRFIGADINLGSVQTTTKRLIGIQRDLIDQIQNDEALLEVNDEARAEPSVFMGFEVYNVNNYDFFRNPLEAKKLLMDALEVQPFAQSVVWDGELDGRMVKIMPVNRIATKADLEEIKANLPYKTYEKRKEENPGRPVERITLVCMGHEPDLKASLERELEQYKVDVEVVDILRDRKDLQLKREAQAEVVREGSKLIVRSFYPLNLMQKLSLQEDYVEDWRQLVESIMIDWNFDGVVMTPDVTDVPDKNELVAGIYDIPADAGTIKIKLTDLLAESLEVEVR
jgi:site-specific DNA-methyltransferase (adenine-specific)